MCFLPICSGRQKPKISFFAGRLRSNIFRRPSGKTSSFFFFFRRRLVMVFGGQITFSTPQKCFAAPKNISRRLFSFFRRSEKPPFFGAKNQKSAFSAGVEGAIFFGAQAEKPLLFFFFPAPPRYGVRRPNYFFDSPKIFCGPQKCFAAVFFFFIGALKNRRFSAPKTKNRLFRRASKEQYFSRPKRKNLGFFFFFRRRLVMVFGGQMAFSTPQ